MSKSKQLVVKGPEGEKTFSFNDSPVLIGRSSTAHIRYSESFISRQHLEVVWNGTGWHIQVSSTRGIFDSDGSKLPDLVTVESDTEIRLAIKDGPRLSLRLGEASSTPQKPAPSKDASLSRFFDEPTTTTVAGKSAARSTNSTPTNSAPPTHSPPLSNPPARTDHMVRSAKKPTTNHTSQQVTPRSAVTSSSPNALQIIVDDRNYFFEPGTVVTVGRDPNSLVKIAESHSLVSRKHLQIIYQTGNWCLHDSSSKGTFIQGKKIQPGQEPQGTSVVYLGDPQSGVPLTIVTPAISDESEDSKTPLILGAIAVLILIAVVWLGIFFNRGEEFNLEDAKKSTVLLIGGQIDDGTFVPKQVGTGFFVEDDLILTNQHTSLEEVLLVGVTRNPNEPAVIEYSATKVRNHPYLDVALLKVDAKTVIADGVVRKTALVEPIGLPAVKLGDSNELRTGDEALSTGFPQSLAPNAFVSINNITTQASVSVVEGGFANINRWPGCNADQSEKDLVSGLAENVGCSPDGSIDKAIAISTFASGRGASGSPVYRGDEVIAILYGGPPNNASTSYSITTAAFSSWLEKEITANGQEQTS